MIPFNKPPGTGFELGCMEAAIRSEKLSGDGEFTKKCQAWFGRYLGCHSSLMTPSCTHALEMAALLLDIQPGDEVIMPSYTFVSTANAFVLRGAKIVFVDVRPDTLNIDEQLIEDAITDRTRAIVPVHYAGVGCEMEVIMEIADRHNLYVVEDAAQAMKAAYKDRPLGGVGHLGAYSFHETKNYTSGGEGGLLIINDARFTERAEIIREKGTNRSQFFRGMVDKYSWVDIGSSYLPSELQAAYLWAQLEKVDEINDGRLRSWQFYKEGLASLEQRGLLELPSVPSHCQHNAHMFYIKVKDLEQRSSLLEFLKAKGIGAVFHYVPLHTSVAGKRFGRFHGEDRYTTKESERVVRLPMYYGLQQGDIAKVTDAIYEFYRMDAA